MHSANIAGGLHHAMPDRASGFCIYNDLAVGIRWLLDNGATKVAYVDVDVHHGDGVEKNVGLAVNWLATAAKKQHAAAQATLGEILWRGQDVVRQRQARGLALIILAHDNAVASGKEPQWIGDLYREAFGKSDSVTRKDAEAMLPELSGVQAASAVPTAKAKPTEVMVVPASGAAAKAAGSPTASAAADTAPLSKPSAPPPAPIGMSVGFGATGTKP